MKKIILICSLFLLGTIITKATSLNAGDIAISSINSDLDDDFSFVLLTPISGTTTIYFTDNGWDDDANGGFANPTWRGTSEGTITWTFTGALPCGTEIQISTPAAAVSSASQGTLIKTGSFNLSSTADHLLAYTGTGVPLDGTEITNFITAFGLGAAGWTSDASTTGTSALPPGLTDGGNAIATLNSADNFQYDCSTVSPVNSLRTALVTVGNYTSGTTNENYQGPACAYSCGATCSVTFGIDPITACDSLTWTNGITYYTDNFTAKDTLTNAGGCDSIVTLDLALNYSTPGTTTDIRTECDSLVWTNGVTYFTNNSTAKDTLVNTTGCDSIVILDLTLIPSSIGTDVITGCNNLTWIDGVTYTANNNIATFNIVAGAANGCDSLVSLDLTMNYTDTSTSVVSQTITSNETTTGTSYRWLDCNNSNAVILSEIGISYIAPTNGSFAVEVTNGSCIDTSACVTIIGVGINNLLLESISLYPNPTTNIITVDFGSHSEPLNYSVLSIEGKIIKQVQNIIKDKTTIDLSAENKGIYLLKIEIDSSTKFYKLVKK